MARVSVVIPVKDGEVTLARAIDSALAQRFDDVELIAVNDGSSDRTAAILAAYGERIRVLTHATPRGPAAARNAAARASSGEYLAFLDADDWWAPEMLRKLVAALKSETSVALAFCDAVAVDAAGRATQSSLVTPEYGHAPTMAELLARWWPIIPSAALISRAVFERCGGFDEGFASPGWEDPYLWLRAREHGEFRYVAEPLVFYRMAPLMDRLRKYGPGSKVFTRRVRERYGAAAQPLIDEIRRARLSSLGHEGLLAMRRGDRRQARAAFLMALRERPLHLRSMLRLMRTFLPRAAAQALSGRTRSVP